MKNLIVALLLLGVSATAFGQWCNKPNQSFCPGNFFKNGDFETITGDPNTRGDQDINLATGWQAMWGSGSLADLFCTGGSVTGTAPTPNTNVYAGMWIENRATAASNAIWREGMYNRLSTTIAKNTGSYSFNFKIANSLLSGTNPANPVRIGLYGVYNPSNILASAPTNTHVPTNLNLWGGGVQVVLLGTVTAPTSFTNTWLPQSVTFNSSILPTGGITHIMVTADDTYRPSPMGKLYINFDEFCLQRATFCCPNLSGTTPPPINYTPFGHPDYPKAICPCNSNVISTAKCEGATYAWTVTPSTVTFSGQGTSQIALNGSTLADPLSSIAVKVVITCPSGVSITSTQTIPILNGCNTTGTPTVNVNWTSGSAGTLTASAACPNFGQGWTLKAWNMPHNVNCSQWEAGPIIAQGQGASFTFSNVQTGKFYRLAYYSERCSKTWKNACTKVKFVCFTVYPSSSIKAPDGFAGAQTKQLGNGRTLAFFITDGEDPNDGKQ